MDIIGNMRFVFRMKRTRAIIIGWGNMALAFIGFAIVGLAVRFENFFACFVQPFMFNSNHGIALHYVRIFCKIGSGFALSQLISSMILIMGLLKQRRLFLLPFMYFYLCVLIALGHFAIFLFYIGYMQSNGTMITALLIAYVGITFFRRLYCPVADVYYTMMYLDNKSIQLLYKDDESESVT